MPKVAERGRLTVPTFGRWAM